MFVCRYAFALYSLRHRELLFGNVEEGPGGRCFYQFITKSAAFDFSMVDILRIREELGILIDRLSIVYKTWIDEKYVADNMGNDSDDVCEIVNVD
jgi:hypothetical protein